MAETRKTRSLELTSRWRSRFSEEALEKIRTTCKRKGEQIMRTDAILPIAEGHMRLISDGRKNYDYRYKLANEVRWLWFYVTAPTSAITHIALTGPAKRPGEIKNSLGVGNDDFDEGKRPGRVGYPIRKLYRIRTPIKRVDLINDYGAMTEQGPMKTKAKLMLARKAWLDLELVFDHTNLI